MEDICNGNLQILKENLSNCLVNYTSYKYCLASNHQTRITRELLRWEIPTQFDGNMVIGPNSACRLVILNNIILIFIKIKIILFNFFLKKIKFNTTKSHIILVKFDKANFQTNG